MYQNHSTTHLQHLTTITMSPNTIKSSTTSPHILVYPYPASGHSIPCFHLIYHLLCRNLTVTALLIPSTATLLDPLLPLFPTTLHSLLLHPDPTPFTAHKQSRFSKMFALRDLDDQISSWFHSHPSPPVAIISDFFLGWTTTLANKQGIKRLVFFTTGAHSVNINNSLWLGRPPFVILPGEDRAFSFPQLPNSPVYPASHLSNLYPEVAVDDPEWHTFMDFWKDNMASHGIVVNSVTELESVHLNYLKTELGHDRVWAVGPLASLTAEENQVTTPSHEVMTWLDQRQAEDSVVFVCFGSRTIITRQQLEVLSAGLDRSGVEFILCVGKEDPTVDYADLLEGYEDRVSGRGFLLKGWAPQVEILNHRAVGSFVTHCGWNSTLEGVSAGVVMLTWPMGAEQFVNASLLVDELGIGMTLGESSVKVPEAEEIAVVVGEAVRQGGKVRERALEMKKVALTSVNGGSSEKDLDNLVQWLSQF